MRARQSRINGPAANPSQTGISDAMIIPLTWLNQGRTCNTNPSTDMTANAYAIHRNARRAHGLSSISPIATTGRAAVSGLVCNRFSL